MPYAPTARRLVMTAALACLALPAAAQTVTISPPQNSHYEVTIPDGYKSATVNSDGKITTRALLTLYLLRIPDNYRAGAKRVGYLKAADQPEDGIVQSTDPAADPGIPGSSFELGTLDEKAALDKYPGARSGFLDETQAKANAAGKKVNFQIFNSLRYYIPLAMEESLLNSSVYNSFPTSADPLPAPGQPQLASVRAGRSDALFNFGDLINLNARPARKAALLGAGVFSAAKYVLPKGTSVLILKDPTKVSVADTATESLTQDTLEAGIEEYGRWYFDLYNVAGPGDGPSGTPLTSLPMVEIRVQWVFQATFDPKNSGLPLLQITQTLPPQAAAVSGASQPTASQTPAAGVAFAQGVDTSSDFTQIVKAASGPGVNLFAGQNFQSNATPSIFGVILSRGDQKPATPQGSSAGASFAASVGKWLDSTGILVGKTTGSHGAYVLGLSKPINSSASLYAGPAFSDSGGIVRTDFSFGVALNLTPIVSDKNGQQTPTTFTISADKETFEKKPGLQASQAAILWTTAAGNIISPSTLPKDEAAPNITFTVDQPAATTQPDPFGFSRNGKPTNYWVSYVLPGKLTDVSVTVKDLKSATGQGTLKWSQGGLVLYEIVGGNRAPTPILYDKAKGFPLEAGQITNIEIEPSPSGQAMAEPTAPPKSARRMGFSQTRRLVPFLPHRQGVAHIRSAPVAYLHQMMAPAPVAQLPVQVALADLPAEPPLISAAGRGGATDLTGAISPPPGVSLDQITLELRASPNGRILMSAQLPFVRDRKPDHFRLSLSVPGKYYLCVTANGQRLCPPIPVFPGTRLSYIDIPDRD